MKKITDEIRWWTAGQLEGDGCVGVYQERLKVSVKKSIKSKSTVDRLHDFYGGSVILMKKEDDNWEDSCTWVTRAEDARQFCQDMLPYLNIKRPQFELASTLVIGRSPSIAFRNNEKRAFKTLAELSKHIGMPMTTLKRRFEKSIYDDLNGWNVQILDKSFILTYRAEVEERLKIMKRIPHLQISNASSIHLAYFAGFVMNNCYFLISQKSNKYKAFG